MATFILLFTKKYSMCYVLLLSTLLSGLFLYYSPGTEEDLYRHYMVFQQVMIRSSDLSYYGNVYMEQSPGYIGYLYLLSFSNNFRVLPFFTGIICYSIYIFLIYDVSRNVEYHRWILILCTCLIFVDIRFMDYGGIRNILSASLMALAVYLDLVKKNKMAVALYIVAGTIHGIAILYFSLRCLICLYQKYSKMIVCVVLTFSAFIVSFLAPIFEKMFSGIPFLSEIFRKIIYYMDSGGLGINRKYRVAYILLYVLVLLLVYVVETYFDSDEKFKSLSAYINIVVFFTFGFIGQREMFNRSRMIVLPFMIVYLLKLLVNVGGRKFLSIRVYTNRQNAIKIAKFSAVAVWGAVIFSLMYFYILTSSDYVLYDTNFQF